MSEFVSQLLDVVGLQATRVLDNVVTGRIDGALQDTCKSLFQEDTILAARCYHNGRVPV